MKKFSFIAVATLLVTLISCEKDELTNTIPAGSVSKNMLINNDLSALNKRITQYSNQPVYNIVNKLSLDAKGASASSINIQLIANLESPKYKEEVLQASHIRIIDGYAYVGYNTQGPRYLGGVDIVYINSAANPKLVSNAVFINPETNAGKDVSSLDLEPAAAGGKNYLWIAGAEENNPLLESPALVEKFALSSSNQFEVNDNPRQYHNLKGYVGTDIRFFKDKIYATSGTGGGFTVLDKDMNVLNFYSLENARSVDVNVNYTVSLGGVQNELYSPELWNSNIGGTVDPEAKSMVRLCYVKLNEIIGTKGTMHLYNFALAALGEYGLKCFNLDLSKSEPSSTLPRPVVPDGKFDKDYVTNGVSISDGGWIYIANGAAGLDIARLDNDGKLTWMGNIDLGASVNFVEATDNYVFVATGLGGLKILKVTEI
jgi:hypothetical protein